jgi:hypothetical protein
MDALALSQMEELKRIRQEIEQDQDNEEVNNL